MELNAYKRNCRIEIQGREKKMGKKRQETETGRIISGREVWERSCGSEIQVRENAGLRNGGDIEENKGERKGKVN